MKNPSGGGFGPNSGRNIPWLATDDDAAEAEITLSFDDNRLASRLFGQYDQNLAFIEKRLGIRATARGNLVNLVGSADPCEQGKVVLENLYARLKSGHDVNLGDVDGAIRMTTSQGSLFEADGAPRLGHEEIVTRKRTVRARTPAQDAYIRALKRHELVFGIGPAGTGKTYLAVACAVDALERDAIKKIVLTRPAVEAGERLGFLPGDLAQKVDPYLRPLYDALYDLMGFDRVAKMFERQAIEIAPLAYMRGRTLNGAFIILDEAQNTTPEQMKMFLTRIGFGSRAVVTGDMTQMDLPRGQPSGLIEARRVLRDVRGIAFTEFDSSDVVRHPLVARIVDAYERHAPRDPG